MNVQDKITAHLKSNQNIKKAKLGLDISTCVALLTALAAAGSAVLPTVSQFLPPSILAIASGTIAVINIIVGKKTELGVISAFLTTSPLTVDQKKEGE